LKDSDAAQYQAFVQVPGSNPPRYLVGVVKLDNLGRGTFDQTFKRGGK